MHIAKKHSFVLIPIHAAMPLLSEKTSSISPQLILPFCETMKPFRWFLIGQSVVRSAILLGSNRITYVERIAYVLIPATGLGTVASARKVTVGTHTTNMVAKVFNLVTTNSNISEKIKHILTNFYYIMMPYFGDRKIVTIF